MSDAAPPEPALVFFDGDCGLCRGFVRRVAAADARGAFRFAPQGGETWRRAGLGAPPGDTVVLIDERGRAFYRGDAVVAVCRRLGGRFAVAGALLRVVPRVLRDAAYAWVARRRRRFATDDANSCPVPSPELRARFLP